jgi:hypothetical protein
MCTYGAISMPNTEMVRVTALVGNSALLDQDGLEHGSPLSAGTFIHNGSSGDLNGWGDVCFFLSPSPSLHLMLFH